MSCDGCCDGADVIGIVTVSFSFQFCEAPIDSSPKKYGAQTATATIGGDRAAGRRRRLLPTGTGAAMVAELDGLWLRSSATRTNARCWGFARFDSEIRISRDGR